MIELEDGFIVVGDVLENLSYLDDESVRCAVTSPPYFGLRDYGTDGQIGLEKTPNEYVEKIVAVFREVRRVLKKDGTLWLNLGDSYIAQKTGSPGKGGQFLQGGRKTQKVASNRPTKKAQGLKPKDLIGIPWRVAFALQADGWYLRQDIIWHKPNPMPESVRDRCTKSHEYLFLMSKSSKYYFDHEAIKEPSAQPNRKRADKMGGNKYQKGVKHSDGSVFTGSKTRNRRDVWSITTKPFKGAHFAVFPEDLVEPCILAGSQKGDIVLDPFLGSGTVGVVARRHERMFIGVELNPEYAEIAKKRIEGS